jgi:GAF domain-containing protein
VVSAEPDARMTIEDIEAGSDLAELMRDQAQSLHEARSVDETLQGITEAAIGTIPGVEWAGITLVTDRRQLETRAPTNPIVARVDVEQYDAGEGPCLSALWDDMVVRADDIETESRWPIWAKQVRGLGVGSMLAFRLFVRGNVLGALNTYAPAAGAYDDDSESVGALFAAHAAIALSGAEEIEQLRRAASTRDVIGQAKGILMERHDLDSDTAAFDLLVRASQTTHRKLHEVAREVVERRTAGRRS